MGPNGSGKSTLSYVIAGRPGYEVTAGSVTLDGEDLLALDPHERAAKGMFLGFQYPVEIPGVSNVQFLRTALNAQRRARGEAELSAGDFLRLAREQGEKLGVSMDMLKRPGNVGFWGGEKKRNEMVQRGIIAPRLAVLDETDSGLDIDALRVVGEGINRIMRKPDKGVLLITHYQRLLDIVEPDFVHVLAGGRIVRSGGAELAQELEREGYGELAAGSGPHQVLPPPLWGRAGWGVRTARSARGCAAHPSPTPSGHPLPQGERDYDRAHSSFPHRRSLAVERSFGAAEAGGARADQAGAGC